MIFISSGCSHQRDIYQNLHEIRSWGFSQIELTGNIEAFDHDHFLENFHENLTNEFTLRTHNYFPAPTKPFVLNLSANDDQVNNSLDLIEKALFFSSQFDSEKHGIHAGFRLNPKSHELGRKLDPRKLMDYETALANMVKNFNKISNTKSIYIENNVYSKLNKNVFGSDNPFLLCSFKQLIELKNLIDFNFLLDIGHLKVSCHSLGLDFESELDQMLDFTDYIHISDNDGEADQNLALVEDSALFGILKNNSSKLKECDFTIEVYSGEADVKKTVKCLESLSD